MYILANNEMWKLRKIRNQKAFELYLIRLDGREKLECVTLAQNPSEAIKNTLGRDELKYDVQKLDTRTAKKIIKASIIYMNMPETQKENAELKRRA